MGPRRAKPAQKGAAVGKCSSERKRAKTSPENETMRMHSQLGRISSVLLKAKFRPVLCSGDSEGAVPTREKGPACRRELAELRQWGVGGWQPELQASNSRFSATAISGWELASEKGPTKPGCRSGGSRALVSEVVQSQGDAKQGQRLGAYWYRAGVCKGSPRADHLRQRYAKTMVTMRLSRAVLAGLYVHLVWRGLYLCVLSTGTHCCGGALSPRV